MAGSFRYVYCCFRDFNASILARIVVNSNFLRQIGLVSNRRFNVLGRLCVTSYNLGNGSCCSNCTFFTFIINGCNERGFIRTAHSKGLAKRKVLWGHSLKNALIPVVTMTGLQFGFLLGGSVVTE